MKTPAKLLVLASLAFAQDRETPVDNQFVQVIQVHRAMPGVKTRPHRHAVNRVMIYLNAGGQNITYEDGKVEKLVWKAGQALWSPAGGMHVAEIQGSEPARIVEVELKREASKRLIPFSGRDPVRIDPKHYTVDFEKPQVRVTRVRLGPGEQTPVVDHNLARLVTYLTEHDIEVTPEHGAPRQEHRRAEQVEWLEPAVESIRNTGARPAEAVVIYFKY
jgi:predicted metal-dependent enzyme (double-stranded beta helix superfamily)